MRVSVRTLPWLVALAGLAIPLVGTGFAVWIPIAAWLVVLALGWVLSRRRETTRDQRIGVALVLLPILFLLAFEGGWWLIPADLTWLAIELVSRGRVKGEPTARDSIA